MGVEDLQEIFILILNHLFFTKWRRECENFIKILTYRFLKNL